METLQEIQQELSSIDVQVKNLLDRKEQLLQLQDQLQQEIVQQAKWSGTDWSSDSNFTWSNQLLQISRDTFGIENFRQYQLEAMNVTLSEIDCILILPTGAGKSLCYQIPALLSQGFTLVISPLVSLMQDQIISLKLKGVEGVEMLSAETEPSHTKAVYQRMLSDNEGILKILFVTPEKIGKSKRFLSNLEKANNCNRLARIVVDEVHCTSQWGNDFRPDYKALGVLKRQFPSVPLLGLTATASEAITQDIKTILSLSTCCMIFRGSMTRVNLIYEVRQKPSSHTDTINDMVSLINDKFRNQSGIIYCCTRKESETVASDLVSKGIHAAFYHADMEMSERSSVHRHWIENKVNVIVGTIAFGMGIDKPDVRFVIHHTISKSIENYYQESGRAGRDGQLARCILYYRPLDAFKLSCMVFMEQTGQKNLYKMLQYCNNIKTCRRKLIADHFVDNIASCNCSICDTCSNSSNVISSDQNEICHFILRTIQQATDGDVNLTPLKIVKNIQKHFSNLDIFMIEKVIVTMTLRGLLKENLHFTPYSTICYLIAGMKASTSKQENFKFVVDTFENASMKRQAPKEIARSSSKKLKRQNAVVDDRDVVTID
ncbi:ATP-dependent DNA helicase Q1 [Trichoplax sp. H2]|nr:ATP-dependent DNA helicase Q1 [Trichoplax sp. H2]|eukprot:RDD42844.1 ATP-dependent DNA helicase Q1 [Trichoplax sp. H2]